MNVGRIKDTRVILSLKEARDYLSEKFHSQVPDIVSQVKTLQESDAVLRHPDDGIGRRNTGHKAGLYMHLRIGPYVCAEWNFG